MSMNIFVEFENLFFLKLNIGIAIFYK